MENTTKKNVKLEKQDLNKAFWSWQFNAMATLSYEKLEATGFSYSMIPIAEKLYGKGTKEYAECLERHSVFYNTEPQTGVIINGIVASMEESKANGEEVTDADFTSVKSALMGPIAGVGDSIIQGIFVPLVLSIGMGLSSDGSPIGVIFYVLVFNIVMLTLDRYLFNTGYKLGVKSIDIFVGKKSEAVRTALNVLGIMVAGGVAASFVHLNTGIEILNKVTNQTFVVQDAFDKFFPGFLGLMAVLLCYNLISKHKVSTNKILFILIGISVVGVLLGIF